MNIYLVESYSTAQSLEAGLNKHCKNYNVFKIMKNGNLFIVVYIKNKL